MQLIDGKSTAQKIKEEIAEEVKALRADGHKVPHLAVILVGEDGGSKSYVAGKIRDCEQVGFNSTLITMDDDVTEEQLLDEVRQLNEDEDIDGFIVQLPLPKHIDEQKVIEAVDSKKDVDGFHPANYGRMALGLDAFLPATPMGILELLKRHEVETEGKHCVVLGRSHIVGAPMSVLMGRNNYPGNSTVTMAHSRTKNLPELTRSADILIVGIGKPEFVTEDMVKEGAVVIDVGTTRVPSTETKSGFRLKGDVDFNGVKDKVSAITPVPGGVGPMTRAALLLNTLKAIKQ
ncbi:MAG: bifunctional 5,10-methylene-tetrahydrofolate dehydrogenase/5,10-methylene-tetrahydrofolate cyclohydrolase [Flavobacteriales bacterium]|nr:bifunctional 5,10-methylene-tetrahydrofolate dehydrogenase/5,10-methylene-tetrahydrofolate cyclohydrolase [Flavobacteriales bacterium]